MGAGMHEQDINLLPMQKSWFIEDWDPAHPRYHHITSLFNVMETMTASLLRTTITLLLRQHDMLRLRVISDATQPRYMISESEDVPFYWMDLSCVPSDKQIKQIEEAARDLHKTIDPFAGSLVRVAYFQRGHGLPDQLLLIFHHVVTDGYSQAILYNDIERMYQLARQGKEFSLPEKTASFKSWLECLNDYVETHLTHDRGWLDYYLALPWQKLVSLPADSPEPTTEAIIADTQMVTASLSAADLRALLKWLPSLRIQLLDIFLATLVHAYAKWTGMPVLFLMLTDHGRAIFPTLDVSQTVGTFAHSRWIFLDLSHCFNRKEMLLATKRQVQKTPNRGFDLEFAYYHLNDQGIIKQVETLMSKYQIQFNFVGSLPQHLRPTGGVADKRVFQLTHGNVGVPDEENTYTTKRFPLYCYCAMLRDELHCSWKYDGNAYRRATIEAFAQLYVESLREFARESTWFV